MNFIILVFVLYYLQGAFGLSKLLVAIGMSNPYTDSVEIIDLSSSRASKRCKAFPNFPYPEGYAAGILDDRDRPLICGGVTREAACHVFERGAWQSFSSLTVDRFGHALIRSPFTDGESKLFVTGGFDVDTSEVLDDFGWQVSVGLPAVVHRHCMLQVDSKTVLIAGGVQHNQISRKTFFFNSETNVWTDGPVMISARNGASCGVIRKQEEGQEKSVIVAGGEDAEYFNSVEVLDLTTLQWSSGPSLPIAITFSAMVEDPSGGVILIGGFDGTHYLDRLFQLDHVGSGAQWRELPQKLNIPRSAHTAFFVPDEITDCS